MAELLEGGESARVQQFEARSLDEIMSQARIVGVDGMPGRGQGPASGGECLGRAAMGGRARGRTLPIELDFEPLPEEMVATKRARW